MSTRSSGRAPKPPQRLITIEEGPQLASRSDRVSFAQLGEQHAREVESRGGEEPTDEEVDEVSVVPSGPGSAAAHPTTEPRQKKTRVSKKWNTLYDLVLAQKGVCERDSVFFWNFLRSREERRARMLLGARVFVSRADALRVRTRSREANYLLVLEKCLLFRWGAVAGARCE